MLVYGASVSQPQCTLPDATLQQRQQQQQQRQGAEPMAQLAPPSARSAPANQLLQYGEAPTSLAGATHFSMSTASLLFGNCAERSDWQMFKLANDSLNSNSLSQTANSLPQLPRQAPSNLPQQQAAQQQDTRQQTQYHGSGQRWQQQLDSVFMPPSADALMQSGGAVPSMSLESDLESDLELLVAFSSQQAAPVHCNSS
jgi:hypothetical protein